MLKNLKAKLQAMKSSGEQSKEAQAQKADAQGTDEAEDALEETGTFMLDVKTLKECEDLEDLLNDV